MESDRCQNSTDLFSENDSYLTNIRKVETFKVITNTYIIKQIITRSYQKISYMACNFFIK